MPGQSDGATCTLSSPKSGQPRQGLGRVAVGFNPRSRRGEACSRPEGAVFRSDRAPSGRKSVDACPRFRGLKPTATRPYAFGVGPRAACPTWVTTDTRTRSFDVWPPRPRLAGRRSGCVRRVVVALALLSGGLAPAQAEQAMSPWEKLWHNPKIRPWKDYPFVKKRADAGSA